MMPDKHAREQLLDLLDKKAFDPVLKASPNHYKSESDKQKLRDLQETTRHTQQSYHEKYTTAEEVRKNFRRDLSSEAAKKVHRELRDLGLPTLDELKDEFEQLADQLGVKH
jgi:hypothetical protein